MNETLQKIRQETLERLKAAKDESEIESLSVSVFGKSGSLTEKMCIRDRCRIPYISYKNPPTRLWSRDKGAYCSRRR